MTINLKNKAEIISKYGKNEKDTGNVDVQVAMLSKKISELTEHLKINKKFKNLEGYVWIKLLLEKNLIARQITEKLALALWLKTKKYF